MAKPTMRKKVEVDVAIIERLLDQKSAQVASTVAAPTFTLEQAAERNVSVGRLIAFEEVKVMLTELVDSLNEDGEIVTDEDADE